MEMHPEIKLDKMILCGAIVRRDYPWSQVLGARGQADRVLNDYGRKDILAKIVGWFVADADSSVSSGFKDDAGGRVLNRCHPEFRHSDFFYALNYQNVWIPFLKGNDPPPDVKMDRRPVNWKFRIVLLAVLILIGLLLWFVIGPRLRNLPVAVHPAGPPSGSGVVSTPSTMNIAPLTGSSGKELDSSISPNGSDVAYSWDGTNAGTRSIYVKRIGSGRARPLTEESDGDVQSPVWSVDGLHIYYVHPVADKNEIWVMAVARLS
jgi:hypothetical protein